MSSEDVSRFHAPPPSYDEAVAMPSGSEEVTAAAEAVVASALAAVAFNTTGEATGEDEGAKVGGSGLSKATATGGVPAPAPAKSSGAGAGGAGAGAGSGAGASAGVGASTGEEASAGATAVAPPAVEHPVVPFTRRCKALHKYIKLVVWDFDLTLLRIHAYGQRVQPFDVKSGRRVLERDFVDLHMFQALVKYLVNEAGIGVAVASFGAHPTIAAYLDKAFPEPDNHGAPYFTRENTSTPGLIGLQDGRSVRDGKIPQLNDLIARYGCQRDEVLFFDDDKANAHGAARRGFMSFHVPRQGFNNELWALALSDLEVMEEEDSRAAQDAAAASAAASAPPAPSAPSAPLA